MVHENSQNSNNLFLAKRWHSGTESIFSEMTALANKHDAINLGQGAPNFYGPQKLLDAICTQMQTCHNQYSPAAGEPELLAEISKFILKNTGVSYNPSSEIIITSGASEALFCALNAYLSPNDNVILFEPLFDLYAQAIANTGANILSVPLIPPSFENNQSSNEWNIDWEQFEAATRKGFKCIIINTPHNPTGKIFTAEEQRRIGQAALANNALIFSDEVYENLSFEKSVPYNSIVSLKEFRDITVRISSAAKTFGFTGLKIGWASGPAHLIRGMHLVHQSTVFCVNPAIQLGLSECLKDTNWLNAYLKTECESYKNKRNILMKILYESEFLPSACEGTFFICANYKNISDEPNSVQFAKKYVQTNKIATIPLASFYINAPKHFPWVRFAFCKSEHTLYETEKYMAKSHAV